MFLKRPFYMGGSWGAPFLKTPFPLFQRGENRLGGPFLKKISWMEMGQVGGWTSLGEKKHRGGGKRAFRGSVLC